MFSRASVSILAALVSLTACGVHDSPTTPSVGHPPWDASPLQTDSLVYTLRRTTGEYRAFVHATYHNTTGAPVYFARCLIQDSTLMFWRERTGPDSTRSFFTDSGGWACVGNVPTGTLAPGDSASVNVPFGSVDQPFMQPPLQPYELVGTFRIYLRFCNAPVADSDYCDPAPWEGEISNAFTVQY